VLLDQREWFGDNMLPIAYQTLPKEGVTLQGFEIFVAPTYEKNFGANIVSHIFRATIEGTRVPNPENPEGFITICLHQGEHGLRSGGPTSAHLRT
jgi:hypothetical protein